MADNVLEFVFKARNADEAKLATQQLKDALDQLEKEAKQSSKALDKVGESGKDVGKGGGGTQGMARGIDSMVQKAGGLNGIVTKLGLIGAAAGVAYAGVRGLQQGVKEAVQDLIDSEEATLRLGFALQQAGDYSAGAVKEFQAYADTLEASTKYSADYVSQLGGMIASLGQLSGQTLQRSTKAVLDFSTQTGLGAETIGRLIARIAATGEARGIEQLGLKIDKTKRGAELLEEVLGAMERAAGGASEAAAAGLGGAFTQAAEAAKGLAGDIARAFNLDQVLDDAVRKATAAVNEMRGKFQSIAGDTPDTLAQALEAYTSTLTQYSRAVGQKRNELEEALLIAQGDIEAEIDLRVRRGNLDTLVRDLEEVDRLRTVLAERGLEAGSGDLDLYLQTVAQRLSEGLRTRLVVEKEDLQAELRSAIAGLTDVTVQMRIEGTPELRATEERLERIKQRIAEAQESLAEGRNVGFQVQVPDLSDLATSALASVGRDLELEQELVVAVQARVESATSQDEINALLEELEKRLADSTQAAEKNAAKLGEALAAQRALQEARKAAAARLPQLPDSVASIKVQTEDAQKDLDALAKAVTTTLQAVSTPAAIIISSEEAVRAAENLERVTLAAEAIGPALDRAQAQGNVAGLVQAYVALKAAVEAAGSGASKASAEEVQRLTALRDKAREALEALTPLQAAQALALEGKLELDLGDVRDAELVLIQLRQYLAENPMDVQLRLLVERFEEDLETAKDKAEEGAQDIDQVMLENISGAGFQTLNTALGTALGQMLGGTRQVTDEMDRLFENMVKSILAELAKLAAAQLFKFLLSLVTGGTSAGVGGIVSAITGVGKAGAPDTGGGTGGTGGVTTYTGQVMAQQQTIALQAAASDLAAAAQLLPQAASELVEGVLLGTRDRAFAGNVYVDALEPSDFEDYMVKRGGAVINELARTGRL